jgi:hypothetical protein
MRARAAWAALPLLLSGCGLTEYEEKMQAVQGHLQKAEKFRADKEGLGDELTVPTVTDPKTKTESSMATFHLLPPKGIASKATTARRGGPPHRHEGSGLFTYLEWAASRGEDLKGRVAEWYRGAPPPEPFTIGGHSVLTTVTSLYTERGQPNTVRIFVTPAQEGRTQLLLAYWYEARAWNGDVDPGKDREAQRVIELSMKSLGIDGESYAKRKAYQAVPGNKDQFERRINQDLEERLK